MIVATTTREKPILICSFNLFLSNIYGTLMLWKSCLSCIAIDFGGAFIIKNGKKRVAVSVYLLHPYFLLRFQMISLKDKI